MPCPIAKLVGRTFDLYVVLDDTSMSEASDLLSKVSAEEGVGLAILRFVGIGAFVVRTFVFGIVYR